MVVVAFAEGGAALEFWECSDHIDVVVIVALGAIEGAEFAVSAAGTGGCRWYGTGRKKKEERHPSFLS